MRHPNFLSPKCPCRRLWGEALEAAKRCLTEDTAFDTCDSLIQKMEAVASLIDQGDVKTLQQVSKQISECAAVQDVKNMLHHSTKTGADEKADNLTKSIDKVKTLIEQFNEPSSLEEELSKLWLNTTCLKLSQAPQFLECLWKNGVRGLTHKSHAFMMFCFQNCCCKQWWTCMFLDWTVICCIVVLSAAAGLVNVHLIQTTPRALYRAASDLSTILMDFVTTETPDLSTFFATLSSLKTVLNSCQSLEIIPRWVTDGNLACDRFTLLCDQEGKSFLKKIVLESGAAAALEKVQSMKIQATPDFQNALDVLKQGKLLDDVTQGKTAKLDEEMSHTCQAVKSMMTLSSLAIEDIKLFFPGVEEKLRTFQAEVEAHLEKVFVSSEKFIKKGAGLIHKYRQVWAMRSWAMMSLLTPRQLLNCHCDQTWTHSQVFSC